MTWGMFTTSLVSVTGLLLSTGALFAAYLSWRRSLSNSAERLSKRLTEVESITEALSAELKSMRAARAMAAHRQRKATEEAQPENPDEARARTLRALAPLIHGVKPNAK